MLKLADDLHLPPEAALQRFGILAMSGAGKSNTAVVMAEEMYDAGIPWVAIDPKGDWWGVRSSRTGKRAGLEVPVFGGLHGDVPLEPTAGKLIAETIASKRLTCVLDVSEFESKADQMRFLTAFAKTLLRKNRHALHVFAEEADEYLPQQVRSEMAECVGAWTRLVKRGRFRGVFVSLITQRSAELSKAALSQVDTLLPMRTTWDADIRKISQWAAAQGIAKDALDSLPNLEDGEAWVWSPHKLKLIERKQLRRRRTFDSGSTPGLDALDIEPTRLAQVDLSEIEEAMAETIEQAKKDDPDVLRKRIRELESELAKKPEVVEAEPVEPEIVEVAVFPEPLKKAIRETLEQVAADAERLGSEARKSAEHHIENLDANFELALEIQEAPPVPRPSPVVKPAPRPSETRSDLDRAPDVQVDLDGLSLKKGEVKMLQTAAQYHPLRLTRVQLGTLAGFTARGGTFRNYLGTLKRNGLVEEEDKEVFITTAGFDALGQDVPPPPRNIEERTEVWRSVLKEGERAMLDVLIRLNGEWISRADLGVQAATPNNPEGFTPSGGTFRNYLGTLVRNGLAVKRGSDVRVGDWLFVGVTDEGVKVAP